MTKISWSRFLFLMTLALVLALAACGGDSSEEDTSSDDASSEGSGEESSDESGEEGDTAGGEIYNYEDFPKTVSNTGDPSGEGTLNIGYSSDTPFEGTLNWAFYQGAPDADMMAHFDEAVLAMDEDFQYTNEGAVQFELNEDDNTVTFTVRDGVNWHDGEPLTIQDYVSSYEIIGHPDYDGVRGSTDGFTLIEGYEEYRSGEADSISGIEIVDDKTAVFTYTELAPSLTAGGFWSYAFPTHYYEGLEVSEMAAAPQTRENPIGIGPYKVDSIVAGESISMSKFEDYWRGEPGVSEVTVRVIAPSSIASAVESGEIDIAKSFPTDQYPDVSDIDGVEWLANVE
ncbi:MAG: oligopeptide ABC transporter substrate-binding protein, partial [Jeotgalicoccus halophilus]|nr:oligopeptide ABC transporter substrate-binding protein [Jeotgalicoccus aerolatus]